MKKIYSIFLLCALLLLTSCGSSEPEAETPKELGAKDIYIYYINNDHTDLWPVPYTQESNEDVIVKIGKIMNQLETVEDKGTYCSPVPKGVIYNNCSHGKRKGNIEIKFDINYDSVSPEDLLFFKACVSKSILNIDGVNSLTMYLTDLSNSDEETATVSESFDYDSFNMAFGDENGYTQQGTIVVYFANEDGSYLKEYRKNVEISNTTSLPRLVVETLIEGPDDDTCIATVSEDTRIQKISVKDGICYVDLSEEFYDAGNPLRNDIIVYSVVNSLVELPNVSKVQFLKDGEKQTLFRGSLPFDGIFERNLDLIEQEVIENP